MRKCLEIVCLFLLSYFITEAKQVRIGLFTSINSVSSTVIVAQGKYRLFADDKPSANLTIGDYLLMTVMSDSIELVRNGVILKKCKHAKIASMTSGGIFRLKSNQPVTTALPYQDNLEIRITNNYLGIINLLDLEKYVASVVESESGDNSNPEFLKVQAILVRTYALNDLRRHSSEGFSLCDAVHCQVYKCRNRFNPMVERAVNETRNKVLCDENGRMVMSVYHSNCGGQTLPSGDLWSKDVPYLVSVRDTFCTAGQHATWNRMLSKKEWKRYLKKNMNLRLDTLSDEALFCFDQPERMREICIAENPISLKKIRNDWQMKSTFFSIDERGDSLIFSGRGFGHGVGLCQEGAMQMTANGYNYKQILQFYFNKIKILDAASAQTSRN